MPTECTVFDIDRGSRNMMFAYSVITVCLLFVVHCTTACTDTVYVTGDDGQVGKSKDGGETWTTVLNIGNYIYSISGHGDNIYAGTPFGVAVSHNAGASWYIRNLQTNSCCDSTVISVFVDSAQRVYALIGINDGCGRVAISSDNGDTWPTNFPLPNPPFAFDQYSFSRQFNIYVDGPRIYVASNSGFGFSDDVGASWTFKNQSLEANLESRTDPQSLGLDWDNSVIGKGQTIYVGLRMEGSPVSMSQDGGLTWKTVYPFQPMKEGESWSATSIYLQVDTFYVATEGSGLSWSTDFTNWTTKTMTDGLGDVYTYAIVASGNNLYLGTQSGLSISRDKGQTWKNKTTKDGLPCCQIFTVFAQCV